ncbi:hypothetical protein C0991_009390 [Blastosporella zonata]|nr:hypothetical protein C0991_009390 [Blastosporella zonata]
MDHPFTEWTSAVRNANKTLIMKDNLHFTDDKLCAHIWIGLNDDLLVEYTTNNGPAPGLLDSIADFNEWLNQIALLDDNIRECKTCDKQNFLNSMINYHKSQKTSSSTALTKQVSTSNNDAKQRFAYKLDDSECILLDKNTGCRNCRGLFLPTSHVCKYKDTPLPFGIVPKNTAKYVEDKRRKLNKSKLAATTLTIHIAAVFKESSDDDDIEMVEQMPEDSDLYPDEYMLPAHIS